MTFWETIERGEYVMIALALLLIVIICIWCVRGVRLGRLKRKYAPLMHRVRDHVVEGDIENARQLCDVYLSPGSRVVETGLSHIGNRMADVRDAMRDTAEMEKEKMAAGARWLKAIAVISPLLGLGGTLVGVIDRLRDLGESAGMVDTAVVCGAVAPTIVTTVAGLGVGIFSLIALTCLEGSINKARRNLDELAMELIDLLNEPSN